MDLREQEVLSSSCVQQVNVRGTAQNNVHWRTQCEEGPPHGGRRRGEDNGKDKLLPICVLSSIVFATYKVILPASISGSISSKGIW